MTIDQEDHAPKPSSEPSTCGLIKISLATSAA